MTSTLRRPVSPTPTVAMSATLDPSTATPTSGSYRHVCILHKEDHGDVDTNKLIAAIEKKLSAAADTTTRTTTTPSRNHTLRKEEKKTTPQPARQTEAGHVSASPATLTHRVQQSADKSLTLHVKPKTAKARHYDKQQQPSRRTPLMPDEHAYRYQYELHALCYRDAPGVRAAPKPKLKPTTTATTTWRRSGSARVRPGQAGPALCAVGEAMHLLPSNATRAAPTTTLGRSTSVKEKVAVLQPLPEEHVKELYLRAAPDFVQDKARYAHSPSAESLSAQDTLMQQQQQIGSSKGGGADAALSREVATLVRRVQASTGTAANTSERADEQTRDEEEVRLIRALHRASQVAAANEAQQQRLKRRNDTTSLTCGGVDAVMQSALPSNVVLPMQSEGRQANEAGVPQWRLTSPHAHAQVQQQQQQQQRAATAHTQVHRSPYSSAALLWTGAGTRRADNDEGDEEEAMNAWLAAQGGDYLAWTQRRPVTSNNTTSTHGRAPRTRRAHSAAWPAHARSVSVTRYGMHYTNALPQPRCRSTTRDARKYGTQYALEEDEDEEEQYGTWTARSVLLRPPAQVLASASLFRDSAGASSPEEAELMSALRVVRDLLRNHCTSDKEPGSSGNLSYAARLLLSLVLYIRALGGLPTLLEARPLPADSHIVHKEDCIELLFQRSVALTPLTPEQLRQMRNRRRSSGSNSNTSSGNVSSSGANGEAAELPGLRGGVFNAFVRDLPSQVTTQQQEKEQNEEKKEGWVNETEQALLHTLSQVLGRDERRASNATTSATEGGTSETNTTDATLEAAAAWLAGGRRASKDLTSQATTSLDIPTTAMGAQKSPATPALAAPYTSTNRQSAPQRTKTNKMYETVPQSLVAPYEPGRLVSLVVRAVVAQKSQVTCFGGKETVHVLPSLPPVTTSVQANHLLDTLNTYVESLPGGTQDVISDFLRPRNNNSNRNAMSQRDGVNHANTAKKVEKEKRRAQDALTVPGLYGDLVVAFMLSAEASQLGGVLPAAVELEQLRYRVFRLHGYRNSHDFGASIGMQQTNHITNNSDGGGQVESTRAGGRGGNAETTNTFAEDLQRRFGPGPTAVAAAAASGSGSRDDVLHRKGDTTRKLVDAAAQLALYFPLYRACCVSETTLQAAAAEEEDAQGRRARSQRRTAQSRSKEDAGHLLAKGNVMLCEEEKQLMRFRPLRLRAFYNELRKAARGMCAAHDTVLTA